MTSRDDAQRRNAELVSLLEEAGVMREPAVREAFCAVLRHHFLPGRPLHEVYEDSAIMTKIGERGLPVSSSSQPAIMATMLQQLQLESGCRVLEIGAGTGYNAALIAHVVGPAGRVVTIDIDEDLCAQARAHLTAAGVVGVEVVRGDGAAGWPDAVPYDRIIVTASASDLSPAWLEQLAEGGLLVVPLALAGPVQHSVAFVRHGDALFSRDVSPCGFMPLRGDLAAPPDEPDERTAGWLAGLGRASHLAIPTAHLRAGFETWLALTDGRYVRVVLPERQTSTFGLRDEAGMALTWGEGSQQAILVFGSGDALARELAEAHDRWAAGPRSPGVVRVAAYPSGSEPAAPGPGRVLRRPRFTFVVAVT